MSFLRPAIEQGVPWLDWNLHIMSKAILCPVCKGQKLETLRDGSTQLEVDSCPNCMGVWFDSGELETFYKSADLQKRLNPVGGQSLHHTYEISAAARRCPRCRKGMERPLVGGISVDVCRECRGIWFDDGELAKITQIYKSRGLKGDELVAEQVRQGNRPDAKGGALGDAFGVVSWFLGSFLGNKLR